MKDNNVKFHDKKFTQGNAISLLLSRVNKAKVYRGWEHAPRESQKSGEQGLAGIGCSCREETNTSRHGAGKGAGYSIAQTLRSFVCDLLLVTVLPSLPGADGLFLLVCGKVMRKKGEAVIQQLLLDRYNFVLVPTALGPSCMNKLPASTRGAAISSCKMGSKQLSETYILVIDLSYSSGVGEKTRLNINKNYLLDTYLTVQFLLFHQCL